MAISPHRPFFSTRRGGVRHKQALYECCYYFNRHLRFELKVVSSTSSALMHLWCALRAWEGWEGLPRFNEQQHYCCLPARVLSYQSQRFPRGFRKLMAQRWWETGIHLSPFRFISFAALLEYAQLVDRAGAGERFGPAASRARHGQRRHIVASFFAGFVLERGKHGVTATDVARLPLYTCALPCLGLPVRRRPPMAVYTQLRAVRWDVTTLYAIVFVVSLSLHCRTGVLLAGSCGVQSATQASERE